MAENYFAAFLAKRGFTEDSFRDLFKYDPMPIQGTDEACALLRDTPRNARIALLTDYDVDGLMCGVIGYAGLHLLGFTGMYIMPRDIGAGYEFRVQDVESAAGTVLLITADVGITCRDAVLRAKELGMNVIVTDHHVPAKEPCGADVVVDHMLDYNFNKTEAAVCGAFTLWQVFDRYLTLYAEDYGEERLRDIRMDMDILRHFAALATVADSMPLTGRNHHIVAQMLRFFNYINPLSGSPAIVNSVCRDGVLQNLFNNFHTFVLQFQDNYYTGFTQRFLEYSLIPAMNSVRRMYANTSLVYTMFFGRDFEAQECAEALAELNQERKELVAQSLQELMECYSGGQVLMTDARAGILGLLATRVCEAIKRPCVVLNNEPCLDEATGEWCYSGSGRSFAWYPMLTCINGSGYALCAGHEMACGIKVPVKNVELLDSFLDYDTQRMSPLDDNIVKITPENVADDYDVVMDFDENIVDFTADVEAFMHDMKRYGPFGSGLPAPRVLLKFHKREGDVKLLKEGKHVKITLVAPGEGAERGMPHFQILLWNTSFDDILATSSKEGFVYVTGYLQTSYFGGNRFIDFVAKPAMDLRDGENN